MAPSDHPFIRSLVIVNDTPAPTLEIISWLIVVTQKSKQRLLVQYFFWLNANNLLYYSTTFNYVSTLNVQNFVFYC